MRVNTWHLPEDRAGVGPTVVVVVDDPGTVAFGAHTTMIVPFPRIIDTLDPNSSSGVIEP